MGHEQLLLFTAILTFSMLVIGLVLLVFEYRRQNKPENRSNKNKDFDKGP